MTATEIADIAKKIKSGLKKSEIHPELYFHVDANRVYDELEAGTPIMAIEPCAQCKHVPRFTMAVYKSKAKIKLKCKCGKTAEQDLDTFPDDRDIQMLIEEWKSEQEE